MAVKDVPFSSIKRGQRFIYKGKLWERVRGSFGIPVSDIGKGHVGWPIKLDVMVTPSSLSSEPVKLAKELMAGTGLGLEGVSNNKAKKFLNDLMARHTKGVFKDDSWEPVHALFEEFKKQNINYTIVSTEYKDNERGTPTAKEWRVEFDFTNDKGRPTKLYGMIRASGMGTLDDVLARYDIVSYVS
jgi:hypothetical protein